MARHPRPYATSSPGEAWEKIGLCGRAPVTDNRLRLISGCESTTDSGLSLDEEGKVSHPLVVIDMTPPVDESSGATFAFRVRCSKSQVQPGHAGQVFRQFGSYVVHEMREYRTKEVT